MFVLLNVVSFNKNICQRQLEHFEQPVSQASAVVIDVR